MDLSIVIYHKTASTLEISNLQKVLPLTVLLRSWRLKASHILSFSFPAVFNNSQHYCFLQRVLFFHNVRKVTQFTSVSLASREFRIHLEFVSFWLFKVCKTMVSLMNKIFPVWFLHSPAYTSVQINQNIYDFGLIFKDKSFL